VFITNTEGEYRRKCLVAYKPESKRWRVRLEQKVENRTMNVKLTCITVRQVREINGIKSCRRVKRTDMW